jgi:hypothetical protein
MSSMKNPLRVSSPGGEMKTSYICPQVKINIMGVDFLANLVVLKSWGIDVILGMDWLRSCDGVIQCRKKSVLLTSPQGERRVCGYTLIQQWNCEFSRRQDLRR